VIRQRCAIYTRKSTEEGLEQSFNSLDAQREACAAYILSQRHEGWAELSDRYDDGGFSGGSMERPGLQRLLADVRAGRIDVIVVYKVDRLTRALSDFAKIVETFDEAGVSFVSVTQAFNTTSSMGRLTLNVLLSFAQFEREVTAERIRDKVAASKRKGLWMGGAVPFGYDAEDKALVVNPNEAEAVRTIFREYLAVGSVPKLRYRLTRLGIVSKRRTDRYGRVTGGCPFSTGALYHLLRNAIYVGKTRHRGELHDGRHEAIVDETTWRQVQAHLDGNGGGAISGRRKPARRMLDGVLFDRYGRPMRSTYAMRTKHSSGVRQSKRYWYYVSKSEGSDDDRALDRIPAAGLEAIIGEAVRRCLHGREWLIESLDAAGVAPDIIARALDPAEDAAKRLVASTSDEEGGKSPAIFLHRIDCQEVRLCIQLNLAPLLDKPNVNQVLAPPVKVPVRLRRSGRNRPIVLLADTGAPQRDPDLIALVADARRWMDDMIAGRAASVAEITEREQVRPGNVSRVLPLAWLAPDISAAILEGRQPADLTAKKLRDLPDVPLDWTEQRRLLGFPAA
jgi:DNA invertase Pin-like site-specific DNA recombinase